MGDKRFGDLTANEQRLIKSRYEDVKGDSLAMNDSHLSQQTKDLISSQASKRLHEEGWLSSSTEEKSPSIADIAVGILTLGIFGGH